MGKTEVVGPYTLRQSDTCFKLGGDSLALAAFATVKQGDAVCDLGCGPGSLLLLLAAREPFVSLSGVELDADAAELVRRNLAENELPGEIIGGDLRQKPFAPEAFDLVISNPPYFPKRNGKSGGRARCEETCTLEELCVSAARLVNNGGRVALCHRPERLVDVLCALRENRLEPKRLQMVCHAPDRAPSTVLVEAVKNGKPSLTVLPNLLRL